MLKNKKGTSVITIILLVFIIILTVAVIVLGYITLTKENKVETNTTDKVTESNEENVTTENTETKKDASKYHMNITAKKAFLRETPGGDKIYARIGAKIIHMYDFTTGKEGMTISASLEEGKSMVTISAIDADKNPIVENTINAGPEKIDEIALIPCGQDTGNYCLFLLMNDGSLEYIPVFDALMSETHKADKVDGLKDIIKVDYMSAEALIPIALDVDGNYYDITEYTGVISSKKIQDFMDKYKK